MKKSTLPKPKRLLRKLLLLFTAGVLYGLPAAAQQQQIRGVIEDSATLNPLPLATITVRAQGAARITRLADSKGRFSLSLVSGTLLEISYSGYRSRQVRTTAEDSNILILLSPLHVNLDSIVVIGYGQEKKRDLTSSISVLDSKQINETPATDLGGALQGRIPGLEVHSNGYTPGAGTNATIRGLNSITQLEGPLYVVDGVTQTGSINTIDPNDIESVEVLKDAAAAGIYGSRAAEGVILITTKRARAGISTIDFNMYYGVQVEHPSYHMLDGDQYAQMRRIANYNADPVTFPLGGDSTDARIFNIYELASIAGHRTYDWGKAVTHNGAPIQNYSLSISNGTGTNKVFFSGNYLHQDGILINSGFTRYQAFFNIESALTPNLKVGGSTNLAYNFTKGTNNQVYQGALTQSPLMPIFDNTGQPLVVTDNSTGSLTIRNPYTTAVYSINNYKTVDTRANIYLEYKPIRNLLLRSSIGADLFQGEQDVYNPRNTNAGYATNGQAEIYKPGSTDVLWENTATFNWVHGDHDLNVLGGFTFERHENMATDEQGTEFPTDLLTYKDIGSAGIKTQDNSEYDGWAVQSLLARATYKYKARYILSVSGRQDGSSRFGPNNRYGFFPVASFAWRLIDEPWVGYGFKSVVSDLKLRTSYGLIGNQNLPYSAIYTPYTQAAYPFDGNNPVTSGYQVQIGATAGNPNLQWEKQHQFNIGADLGFFNNRVTASVDLYNKDISSLLLPFTLAPSSGFGSEEINVAAMNTRGIDINLSVTPVRTHNFTWQFTFNISSYASKITKLLPNQDSVSLALRVGEPPQGVIVGYVYNGIYQAQDNFALDPNGKPGDIKIKDVNGDGKITPQDEVIIGNSNPKGWGGFWNYFAYKNFTLIVMTTYEYGQKINNQTFTYLTYFDAGYGNTGNVTKQGGNYWTPTNTNTNIPRPDAFGTSLNTIPGGPSIGSPGTSYSVQAGDYIRIKQITLNYDVKASLLRKSRVRTMSIYVQAVEPFLFTKFVGLDPDIANANETYPRFRTFLAGVKLGL